MQHRVEGEGEPIVLVPGGLTGCASWKPHAERLRTTRSVVRVQLVSVEYGLKDEPLPPGYSLDTESGALGAALVETGLNGPVDIAAWSFGAAVALLFALEHPGSVRTLTLIEPPAFWMLDPVPRDPAFEELRSLGEATRTEVSEERLGMFTHLVGIVPPGVEPRNMPQWPMWVRYRRSLRNSFAPFAYRDDPDRVKELRLPVLLVKGTGSAPFLHAVIEALDRRLPDSEVVEYPAGHAPHIVSIDRFLSKMTSFQAAKGSIKMTATE